MYKEIGRKRRDRKRRKGVEDKRKEGIEKKVIKEGRRKGGGGRMRAGGYEQ